MESKFESWKTHESSDIGKIDQTHKDKTQIKPELERMQPSPSKVGSSSKFETEKKLLKDKPSTSDSRDIVPDSFKEKGAYKNRPSVGFFGRLFLYSILFFIPVPRPLSLEHIGEWTRIFRSHNPELPQNTSEWSKWFRIMAFKP